MSFRSAMSFRTAIYYVDLVVRTGLTLEHAISQAREVDANRKASGFDQDALDEAARTGFSNGAFEELVEDVQAVLQEFYPEVAAEQALKSEEHTSDIQLLMPHVNAVFVLN